MLEEIGNIWDHYNEYEGLVITTNGFIKKNGEAVLGRGIAKQAAEKWPWLSKNLGLDLWEVGNHVHSYVTEVDNKEYVVFTMPVKPGTGPDGEPGWKVKADINLIRRSTEELVREVNALWLKKILMVRPGCGNGQLDWEDVKPVIEPMLDDRFTVMEGK